MTHLHLPVSFFHTCFIDCLINWYCEPSWCTVDQKEQIEQIITINQQDQRTDGFNIDSKNKIQNKDICIYFRGSVYGKLIINLLGLIVKPRGSIAYLLLIEKWPCSTSQQCSTSQHGRCLTANWLAYLRRLYHPLCKISSQCVIDYAN